MNGMLAVRRFASGDAPAAAAIIRGLPDCSSGYRPYEATWAFWECSGFIQIDTIDPLPGWQPGNPAAIYVAAVRPTR